MLITSKRGALDNIVTYEHICDTTEDLQKIDPHYITLGSTCIVVQGENGGVDAYIANSTREWVSLNNDNNNKYEKNLEEVSPYENAEVRFIDFDGSIPYGFSPYEFNNLIQMPSAPDHSNNKVPLTSQGWNYTLKDAQNYVEKYGMLEIGQTYIPTDGKTHFIIEITDQLVVPMIFQQTVSEGVTIDWGDGSTAETFIDIGVISTSHTYTEKGEYEITFEVSNNCTLDFGNGVDTSLFNNNYNFSEIIKEIYLGNGITSIGKHAFDTACMNNTILTIPLGVISINERAFNNNRNTNSLIFPKGFATLEDYSFSMNYDCKNISFNKEITKYGIGCFYYCINLKYCTISENIKTWGGSCFYYCISLLKIILPEGIKDIPSAAFMGCRNLEYVYMPNTLTRILASSFVGFWSLQKLIIPENVTTIGNMALSPPTALLNCHFKPKIPPSLGIMNFTNGLSNLKIYVPYSEDHSILEAYKTATNWSTLKSYIIEEEAELNE